MYRRDLQFEAERHEYVCVRGDLLCPSAVCFRVSKWVKEACLACKTEIDSRCCSEPHIPRGGLEAQVVHAKGLPT